MKTAISIPDDLFDQAERLAQRLGKSRSQVYREALAEYLARRDTRAVTERMNAVADEIGPDADWVSAAGRRTLERTEW